MTELEIARSAARDAHARVGSLRSRLSREERDLASATAAVQKTKNELKDAMASSFAADRQQAVAESRQRNREAAEKYHASTPNEILASTMSEEFREASEAYAAAYKAASDAESSGGAVLPL